MEMNIRLVNRLRKLLKCVYAFFFRGQRGLSHYENYDGKGLLKYKDAINSFIKLSQKMNLKELVVHVTLAYETIHKSCIYWLNY